MVAVKNDMVRKFEVDHAGAVSGFANAMQNFPLKKILYRTLFRGKGLEFDSYRIFQPDDDASMIDWKASLRSGGELLARKYIEERELNVYFVVDCSGSVLFGSGDKLKGEFNSEFVIALTHLVLESGDKVGLIMLNDEVKKFVPASRGKNQFHLIRSILSDVNLYGGEFNLKDGIKFSLNAVKSSYTVFIIVSDFIGVKKNATKSIRFLGNKFETMVIMSRDSMDDELPAFKHQMAVTDPSSGKQLIIDPRSVAESFKKNAIRQKKAIKKVFRDANIDILELNSNSKFFLPVANFLVSRAKGGRV